MSDLQAVATEFKKWKGNLSYCRYPTKLWDQAYKLTERYSLQTIASALGITVQYLERKFSKRAKPLEKERDSHRAIPMINPAEAKLDESLATGC